MNSLNSILIEGKVSEMTMKTATLTFVLKSDRFTKQDGKSKKPKKSSDNTKSSKKESPENQGVREVGNG